MFGYILLSLVASAAASSPYINVDSGCPTVKPIENFNFNAFGTGKWYEVARYPNKAEVGGECGWADYVLKGDSFSVENYDVSKGKLRKIDGSARLADDAGNSGKLTLSYPYGENGSITKNTLWVLGTDYENYGVLYHCEENDAKTARRDFNWVFSRSKSLSADSKAAVDKIYKENTFLDFGKVIWNDFSDEACKFEA